MDPVIAGGPKHKSLGRVRLRVFLAPALGPMWLGFTGGLTKQRVSGFCGWE